MTVTAEPHPRERLGRLGRMMLKELRETLRDRRTIITLVLMPLLLYPLVSVGFQRFLLVGMGKTADYRYRLGFRSQQDAQWISEYLVRGGLNLAVLTTSSKPRPPALADEPGIDLRQVEDLAAAVRDLDLDVGIRVIGVGRPNRQNDLAVDFELLYNRDSAHGLEAVAWLERHLARANEAYLQRRLSAAGLTQRAVPVRPVRKLVQGSGTSGGLISISAMIPFILILMTITGAVYPAIDLTAGERERGTLEILVAAPIPRLSLLLAKYVAVLVVALLTAVANLSTLTITLIASGMGRVLFGDAGIPWSAFSAIFFLLLLFAAFFSALLLVLTSFARSFKEAQSYLIPLMLVSLAPAALSLTPGLELSGFLLVLPLANIALLGRDLFELKADGMAAVAVVLSTLFYALSAIAVAARMFGGETVLYGSENGWLDLFRRPKNVQSAPTLTSAVFCLALMFPAFFLSLSLLSQFGGDSIGWRLACSAVVTASVFGLFPLVAAWFGNVQISETFRLRAAAWPAYLAALLFGFSLWTFATEIVVLLREWGLVSFSSDQLEKVQHLVGSMRNVSPLAVVAALAITPAVFEEWFFRGYVLSALRRNSTPVSAIWGSAVLFGAFHLIAMDTLTFERFVPSTLMGVVLGWLCYRSGSLFPGIVVHACHNGLLLLVAYYQRELTALGWGVSEEDHLPLSWLAAGAVCAGLAVLLLQFDQKSHQPVALAPESSLEPH